MKLGLGTVQFGLAYGISNVAGKTSEAEVDKILDVAVHNGIQIIDTAAQYGISEEVLGRRLSKDHKFHIITKTTRFPKGQITSSDLKRLEEAFGASLRNLSVPSVYALLIHDADNLLASGSSLLWDMMAALKQKGLVRKIGVSVYTSLQIDEILNKYCIDIIQLPISILDQRLIRSGHLRTLKKAGIEIHARSAFLQGLLLMKPDSLSRHFDSIKLHLTQYHRNLNLLGITPVQAALGFLAGLDEIDAVICGVNNHHQLEELCAVSAPMRIIDFSKYAINDATILNPSVWHLDT